MADLLLPASIWWPGASAGPSNGVLTGTQSPALPLRYWGFDATNAERIFCSGIVVPANYASGGTLTVLWQCNATAANSVVWGAQVSCVTSGDTDTPLEHAWSTQATTTSAANTTEARRLVASSAISLNMDSASAGDQISFCLERVAANGSDTVTVDAEFLGAIFTYS